MQREYHTWHSHHLGRSMELLAFGHGGTPVLVFPTSLNRFFEWEDRGMIAALQPEISSGRATLYCIDSLDRENLYNRSLHPADRFHAYNAYSAYVFSDVIPFIRSRHPAAGIYAAGASFGAYHAVNAVFKAPGQFSGVIAMGGSYTIRNFTDGYSGTPVLMNDPLDRARAGLGPELTGPLKQMDIRLVTGEHDMCWDPTRQFSDALSANGVSHTFDLWGSGTGHDWKYWHAMIKKHIPAS